MTIPDNFAVAQLMREVASAEVLPRFRNLSAKDISEKSFGELVTVADERAEAALEAGLSALLPGSVVIGEELTARDPSVLDAIDNHVGSMWIVDPVDGTQNFADGKPCFAMIVAYVRNGITRAGWIFEPYSNRMISAELGQGAWEGDLALKVSNRSELRHFHGSLNKRLRKKLREAPVKSSSTIFSKMTRYACVGAEYADLARGKLDFAHYTGNLKPWDHAAGVLIHKEAGGFSAYADTITPYVPAAPHTGRAIIMAPQEEAWYQLRDLTDV